MAEKKKGLKVRDWMVQEVVTLSPSTPMKDAFHILTDREISGAPVLDDRNEVVGILSQTDCLRFILKEGASSHRRVSEYMADIIWTIHPDSVLEFVATIFLDTKLRRLPVIEDDRLVGQISLTDCMKGLRPD